MRILLLLSLVILLHSCSDDKTHLELKRINNFSYYIANQNPYKIDVWVINCSETDFVKYGVLSEIIIKDLTGERRVNFYFYSVLGKKDSLKFDKSEVITIKKNFKKNPCLITSCIHIIKNITNEKIIFYDKILFEIMIFDAKINKIDTLNYAKNDVSVVSLIHNLCLYSENNPSDEFHTQSNYLKVLHIWCEDRKSFPLFDKKDFIVK